MITKQQIKLIHALIGNARLRAQKENIILGISGGRTEHISQLTADEVTGLIKYLQNEAKAQNKDNDNADRQRKLIIHYAHQMGWETEAGKADMPRINAWCVKSGYLHKPLMKHTGAELGRLVQQFQKMYLAFLKHI